jgi:hypothetical protein
MYALLRCDTTAFSAQADWERRIVSSKTIKVDKKKNVCNTKRIVVYRVVLKLESLFSHLPIAFYVIQVHV